MSIQPIDQGSVHRLTSGQVIIDLQSAVKELLDNAFDSEATSIVVHLNNYGLDLIEVQDNGSGIDETNWRGIALKNHTSKLLSFDELSTVSTLGFRGEALSSLCGTADVTLVTTTALTSPMGTRMSFMSNGECVIDSRVARSIGTTVSVKNLFKTLPVRRKELEKHAKREFGKVLDLIQSYALIRFGVRIELKHTIKGRTTTQLQAPITDNLRTKFSSLFSPPVLSKMLDLELRVCLSETASSAQLRHSTEVQVKGLISNPSSGNGRNVNDRCFLYINGRPFSSTKISKAFTDVFRKFSTGLFPWIVANFCMQPDNYDVNVSPDKRIIFLHDEAKLITALKISLESTLALTHSTFTPGSSSSSSFEKDYPEFGLNNSQDLSSTKQTPLPFRPSAQLSSLQPPMSPRGATASSSPIEPQIIKRLECDPSLYTSSPQQSATPPTSVSRLIPAQRPIMQKEATIISTHLNSLQDKTQPDSTVMPPQGSNIFMTSNQDLPIKPLSVHLSTSELQHPWKHLQHFAQLPVTQIPSLEQLYHCAEEGADPSCAGITEEAWQAERALSLVVSKQDFTRMTVVGQFNHAFIIARRILRSPTDSVRACDDLFIIDQHAADEKFNYEDLQRNTVVQSQKLLQPRTLQLLAQDELLAYEQAQILRLNGFDVLLDEDAEAGHRVKLTAQPVSGSTSFGISDFEELLGLLKEYKLGQDKQVPRPSKVQRMFASRACRKSVMFGHALTRMQAKNIVHNMSQMKQPWSCPHGRPTLRWLSHSPSSTGHDARSDVGVLLNQYLPT